jgi:hypothetical protein
MSWFGIVLVIVGLYLAFKLAGFVLKLAMWGLVVVGAYWALAPLFDWPPLAEVIHVMGPG